VKPILWTVPSSSAFSRPANVWAPSANTTFSTPSGSPDAANSRYIACADAAAYSAGFHTTALPHSRAGTRYHDGTATGKFPAVITAATPTGTRKVNRFLSGISDGTVCPYSLRPSPRKKSQVSMISCTSPSASAYGLPISSVTSAARLFLLASTSRPIEAITRPRTGAGTFAHSRCASLAVRHAPANVSASASPTVATVSLSRAGLTEVYESEPAASLPPMTETI
jgi:hypothetical protein